MDRSLRSVDDHDVVCSACRAPYRKRAASARGCPRCGHAAWIAAAIVHAAPAPPVYRAPLGAA